MNKSASQEIIKVLAKAAKEKIYGSVEIYFEQGSVTQITQRIISKVKQGKLTPKSTKVSFRKSSLVSSIKANETVTTPRPI